jgi:hypothetical protein
MAFHSVVVDLTEKKETRPYCQWLSIRLLLISQKERRKEIKKERKKETRTTTNVVSRDLLTK